MVVLPIFRLKTRFDSRSAVVCNPYNWPFIQGRVRNYIWMDEYMNMDGLVEVKGIEPCLLFAQFIEKWVFIMPCCILNFSRFFPSHPGIPLTIFLVIPRNILSSDLELVVSGGRGFVLCWYFISNTFNTFSYLVYCIIFFLD